MIQKAEFYRFLRYSIVGVSTFSIDMALLYVGVEWFSIDYRIAAACSFLCGISLNYILSRTHVFPGTKRTLLTGYVLAMIVALVGALTTSLVLWFVVSMFGIQYLIARVLVAGFVGIGTYTLNARFIFNVPVR